MDRDQLKEQLRYWSKANGAPIFSEALAEIERLERPWWKRLWSALFPTR